MLQRLVPLEKIADKDSRLYGIISLLRSPPFKKRPLCPPQVVPPNFQEFLPNLELLTLEMNLEISAWT